MSGKPWMEEEIKILKEHYPVELVDDVCKMLPNRTREAILRYASYLGLKAYDPLLWTKQEDDILVKYFPIERPATLSKRLPNRTVKSIRGRATELGLKGPNTKRPWTEEEDLIMKNYYPLEGSAVCMRLSGRTKSAVFNRSHDLNLPFQRLYEAWDVREDQIVCEFYLMNTTEWQANNKIDEVVQMLNNHGFFSHERNTVHIKMANYSYLHTGYGLSRASKQSVEVYNEIIKNKNKLY